MEQQIIMAHTLGKRHILQGHELSGQSGEPIDDIAFHNED
jgi:hypothetical protein